ncbi:uncharacterized protein LY89DRAFT_677205 [Mollisia scopiformis]|uniref:Uncharacterized protein n=1 Tax=Mollisia scopiformis TaxID=149040 RepID=A0A132B8M0_MOLSC|nr:uncharacterized protein LY89DRAFT_677205 [Mollisia scopiformis]KUJ08339.1 hypothetical protein LY89DRAFT_677205 [Mollisia scopiformis]
MYRGQYPIGLAYTLCYSRLPPDRPPSNTMSYQFFVRPLPCRIVVVPPHSTANDSLRTGYGEYWVAKRRSANPIRSCGRSLELRSQFQGVSNFMWVRHQSSQIAQAQPDSGSRPDQRYKKPKAPASSFASVHCLSLPSIILQPKRPSLFGDATALIQTILASRFPPSIVPLSYDHQIGLYHRSDYDVAVVWLSKTERVIAYCHVAWQATQHECIVRATSD